MKDCEWFDEYDDINKDVKNATCSIAGYKYIKWGKQPIPEIWCSKHFYIHLNSVILNAKEISEFEYNLLKILK